MSANLIFMEFTVPNETDHNTNGGYMETTHENDTLNMLTVGLASNYSILRVWMHMKEHQKIVLRVSLAVSSTWTWQYLVIWIHEFANYSPFN